MSFPDNSSQNTGDNEKNPFADDPLDTPYNPDPFASPEDGGYNPNLTGYYDTTAPDRSGTLLALGIIGALVALLGTVALLCCLPINLTALVFTLPAWLHAAKTDLHAMELGAVDSERRTQTRVAYWLGLSGTVVALLPVGIFVVLILANIGTTPMLEFRSWLGL